MKRAILFTLIMSLILAPASFANGKGVKITENKEKKQLDVTVDGELFTSYCWWDGQKKPVLYPLKTSKGTVVTRNFPMAKVAGERTDHPHHISSWFTYGDINGVDFWNTPSDDVKSTYDASKMGRIVHKTASKIKNGKNAASVTLQADWIMPDNSKVLQQDEVMTFRSAPNLRIIDRVITLTAQNKKVVFGDSKEGALGIRVARPLEEPSTRPEIFTDANGIPTKVATMDNTGVDGKYVNAEGLKGEKEAWSKRSKWMTLSGNVKGEDVSIAIFDHPKNPTYPTYWHARGYGLFAANPFGAKEFTGGKTVLNYTLEPGQKLTLRFRIVISSGVLGKEHTEAAYNQFLKDITN
jgi:hypothetical protein